MNSPQVALSVGPVLARLREATRDAHARLEQAPLLARLLLPDITIDEYVASLRGLQAFHAGLQVILPPLLRAVPRAAALLHDSTALGALAADIGYFSQAALLPPMVFAVPPVDEFGALGCLYVLEGSALGGRVIGRHVSQILGVAPGQGGAFFCGATAEDARAHWREFCAVLEAACAAGGDAGVTAACVAANACFAALHAAMDIEKSHFPQPRAFAA